MTKKLLGTFIYHGVTITYDGYTENGRSRPIVTCPICGQKRRAQSGYGTRLKRGDVTGRCHACNSKIVGQNIGNALRGKYKRTDDQVLSGGSVIHWGVRDPSAPNRVSVTCGRCGKARFTQISKSLTAPNATGWCLRCTNIAKAKSGAEHPMWKGGRAIDTYGYVWLLVRFLSKDDQSLAISMMNNDGYVLEHRLVMARKLGRPLTHQEVVHHLNGVKSDNRPGNLEVVSSAKHTEEHKVIKDRLRAEILRLQDILSAHNIEF